MPDQPDPRSARRPDASGGRFAAAGIEFALLLGLGTAGGYALDAWLGTLPGLTLAGLAAGFAVALWRLVRAVRTTGGGRSGLAGPAAEDETDPGASESGER
jgi:hypothetical protein